MTTLDLFYAPRVILNGMCGLVGDNHPAVGCSEWCCHTWSSIMFVSRLHPVVADHYKA